jgi:hypothetical protein
MSSETVEQRNANTIIKMKEERKEMLDALKFYANEENYHYIPKCQRNRLIDPDTLVDKDNGKIATEVIKKVEK